MTGSIRRAGSRIHSTDVAIIGAGPCGLFSVFQLGLLGLKCELIDTLAGPGGQCRELYPDKPIYDIPALPVVRADALVERLMQQIAPFEPQFHFGQTATELVETDSGWRIGTDGGRVLNAKAVVLAAGGGNFTPKRPKIPGIADFEGNGVAYTVRDQERYRDSAVVIAGGGDSAVDWAIALAPVAKSLTVLHRRDHFRAAPASTSRMRELQAEGTIDIVVGQARSLQAHDGRLKAIGVSTPEGDRIIETDHLLAFFGLTMQPGPLANWNLGLENGLVPVDTARFETHRPGVFAIGDINTYPGKLKLILSGFHEAALMAQAAKAIVDPGEPNIFQYTTSSTTLRKRLKVLT